MKYLFLGIIAWGITSSSIVEAKFARGEPVPVERLLQNLGKYVQEKPKDPHGYYLLGRIHSLAFINKTRNLNALMPSEGKKTLPVLTDFQKKMKKKKERLKAEALRQHLSHAIQNFQIALTKDPTSGLYHMGLAYLLDKASRFGKNLGVPPLLPTPTTLFESKDLARYWQLKATEYYLEAYELSLAADLNQEAQPLGGLGKMISYEAGRGYVNLIRKLGLEADNAAVVAQIETSFKALEAIPRGAVTPILFPGPAQEKVKSYKELLGDTSVFFDLDSDNEMERWPWVDPATSILVWAPTATSIDSGRKLFGTTTFGMYWRHGYEPLDALDDNRDGWLLGAELVGLAIWTDRNADGISTVAELMPVKARGILGIATKPTGKDGSVYHNGEGIRLKDGRSLPTFDWVTQPLPNRLAQK